MTPDHHPIINDLLKRIRADSEHRRPVIVGIDGPAGSGKSTLAEHLRRGITDLTVTVVHMDDLYPGWDGLAAAVPILVSDILEPLRRNNSAEPAAYRRYDWDAGRYAEQVTVPPADVVIVEGVASGSQPAAAHLDLLVWVQAPRDIRLARGLDRDGEAFAPHWQRWVDQEAEVFATERTRERADVVISGTDPWRNESIAP